MRYLLHDVFTETVKKYPSNTAIIHEGGERVSYEELNSLSNRYANLIKSIKKKVRENPYVGILSCVKKESIASVIGCLKIGCTYVPLDEYSPVERLKYIVESTKLDIIIVESKWFIKFNSLFDSPLISKVILLEDFDDISYLNEKIVLHKELLNFSDAEIPMYNQVCDDLAYILHSSGSTGIPKGIMLTHRNARTFVDWMQKEFNLQESDIVMSRAPFKFDLSVFDIFNTFKAGATLVCYDWCKNREGDRKHLDYVKLMERTNATILYTTPSTFISLMNRGNLNNASLSLRTIMYAGEPFPIPQLRKLSKILPNTKIANIYGPTETNIVTYYWINDIPVNDTDSIPLGYVVDDTEIIVVSEDQKRICEPFELGELWCRGGTVTIGYLGLEEKTSENLVLSPFHRFPTHFWRTGDYGFIDDKGLLHYRGRKDHMVKVKGFRIEIGEVENSISGFLGIDEFAVVAKHDDKYGNRLYCYFSCLKDYTISINLLIEYIKKKLPEYMMPYKFIELETLPKTSSGKIDRVLLQNRNDEN